MIKYILLRDNIGNKASVGIIDGKHSVAPSGYNSCNFKCGVMMQ